MGDSQHPKSAAPQFEVPDLELEPVARSLLARVAPVRACPTATREQRGLDLFDDDAFATAGSGIELGVPERHASPDFGGGPRFDPLGGIELEGNAYSGPAVQLEGRSSAEDRAPPGAPRGDARWPTGQIPERERLAVDALELSIFTGYGEPPKSAYATPGYAYRVFTRQRELRGALRPLEAERQRAETERAGALAELARSVRPDAERLEQFRRLLSPLVELEQIAVQRGEALSSVNAELAARSQAFDDELSAIAEQLSAELGRERDAQHLYDEQSAMAQRADAKLKRVHIEMRAVTQVAEQKLGPRGGKIPEPEATQLATLNQRAAAVQPEVSQAKGALGQAQAALDQASARVAALRQSERLAGRKKQALLQHYEQELGVRGRGLTESEEQQRAALVELGRAVLAARGSVAVPEACLERVRTTSQRADALLLRCEMHLRALDAYDRPRVTQGVRLACTMLAIFVLFVVLKLAL